MTENTDVLALSEELLMSVAYEEELLSESEREHLEQCVLCQQQLSLYKQTNALFRSKLYRFHCPSGIELNYYCLGMLSDESRRSIASHILDCPNCTDDLKEIRQSQANFEAFPAPQFSVPKAIRRLFATYRVQQQGQPVLRDEALDKEWPRQYQAESIDLSLHLSRTDNGEIMLLGIIKTSHAKVPVNVFEGSKVYLYYTPGPLRENSQDAETAVPLLSTEVDMGGNFILEPVPMGIFVILLCLPEQEIVIEELVIDQE